MLRTKDSDPLIHTPSDYILNIKAEIESKSDNFFESVNLVT